MNGGGEKSIEPGFKVMKDEVNANVLAYEPSPGKMTELFQSGQAVLAVWGSGRVQSFANTGYPVDFVYPKEGAVTLLASACPIEKANASPLASEFIKAMLEPSLQLILLKDYGYGPVNKTVQAPAGLGSMAPLGERAAKLINPDWDTINALFAQMAEEGRRLLLDAGADAAAITLRPSADMRHVGQGFEIPVPLPKIALGAMDLPAIRGAFFSSYRERFGRVVEEAPIEALSWRLACAAPGADIRMTGGISMRDTARTTAAAAARGTRDVIFEGIGSLSCTVYDRYALAAGETFEGPALVEERDSTCCIPHGARVRVDSFLNLVIELPAAP
jgi:hypothetical protein